MVMNPPSAAVPVTSTIRVGWALGSVASTFLLFIMNTFYLRFMTDFVGLSAALAGGLLATNKLFDMAINPAVGLITDNTSQRIGRRRPYLLLGTAIGALGLIAMFTVPATLRGSALTAYVVGTLAVASLGYTVFNVPYLAMLAEMTHDPIERARLVSYRIYALAGAQFAAGGLAPLVVGGFGGDRPAFGRMALVFGAAIAAVGLICFLATRRAAVTVLATQARARFFPELATLLRSPLYRTLLLAKATFLVGASAHTVTATYYVRYVLRASDGTLSLFLFAYSAGMVLSQFLWVRLAARCGKIRAFVPAALLYTGISLIWSLINWQAQPALIIALSLLNGAGAGGILLMSEALLPDAIEDDYRLSGLRREGTLAAGFAFAEKGANALGVAFVGFVLSWYGYVAPAQGMHPTAEALRGVMVAFGLIPAFFVGVSCLWWLLVRRDQRTPAPRPQSP
jgi:GPH family glycoside/pentoside/hexuronide:cation symporter